MSTEENVQIVKDFFAAMGGYNEQDLLALAAEDIEWIIPGEGWPLAGTYRGHAELAAVLTKASKEVEIALPRPKRGRITASGSWNQRRGASRDDSRLSTGVVQS
jgi:ketosteroid isomerase-like protein